MATSRCSAIKAGGERCQRIVSQGSEYCYSHDPNRSEERSRHASRAGRRGGNGRGGLDDTAQAIRHCKGLVGRLMSGDVERSVATACFSGLHCLARLLELQRSLHETDELEARIEALERRQRTEQTVWQSRHKRS
jgi:hypothetical protein